MSPPATATPEKHVPAGPALDAGPPADAESHLDEAELVDPAEWLRAHGAKEGSLDKFNYASGCVSIVVGAAREAALLCTDIEDVSAGDDQNPVYRVVSHQIVRVVRAGKVVAVLDVRTRLEPLDGPVPPPGQPWHGIVDLELAIAPDGMSARVDSVDPATKCQARDALRGTTDKEYAREDRAWIMFDDEWITRICNGRGRYIWKSGRFVRAR